MHEKMKNHVNLNMKWKIRYVLAKMNDRAYLFGFVTEGMIFRNPKVPVEYKSPNYCKHGAYTSQNNSKHGEKKKLNSRIKLEHGTKH